MVGIEDRPAGAAAPRAASPAVACARSAASCAGPRHRGRGGRRRSRRCRRGPRRWTSCRRPKLDPPLVVADDRLAVDQRGAARQVGQRPDDGLELVGPVEPRAGEDLGATAADRRQRAVAVELDLVQPVVAGGRRARPAWRAAARRSAAAHRRLPPFPSRSSPAGVASLKRKPSTHSTLPAAISSMVRPLRTLVSAALDDRRRLGAGKVVLLLDQQPVLVLRALALLGPHAHQHPFAAQALAVEDELEVALREALRRRRRPAPTFPRPTA